MIHLVYTRNSLTFKKQRQTASFVYWPMHVLFFNLLKIAEHRKSSATYLVLWLIKVLNIGRQQSGL